MPNPISIREHRGELLRICGDLEKLMSSTTIDDSTKVRVALIYLRERPLVSDDDQSIGGAS